MAPWTGTDGGGTTGSSSPDRTLSSRNPVRRVSTGVPLSLRDPVSQGYPLLCSRFGSSKTTKVGTVSRWRGGEVSSVPVRPGGRSRRRPFLPTRQSGTRTTGSGCGQPVQRDGPVPDGLGEREGDTPSLGRSRPCRRCLTEKV